MPFVMDGQRFAARNPAQVRVRLCLQPRGNGCRITNASFTVLRAWDYLTRMRLVTRSALKRLAVLFVLLGGMLFCGWWSMIRMPLKSYCGPLSALTAEQAALRDELRR